MMEEQEEEQAWWKISQDFVSEKMEAFRCIYFGPEDTSMNLYLSSDETGDRSDLDAQMENNPDVDERRYHYCAHCDFKSLYKASLSKHIRIIHQKQELIKCRLCSFETVDRITLFVHMKDHADVDKRLYQCAYCDFRSKYKYCLRNHIRTMHTKQGLIKCSLCDYHAPCKSRLKAHMGKHRSANEGSYERDQGVLPIVQTKQGLIKCTLCDYQAPYMSRLEVHMAKHMSDDKKPYKCPHCEYRSGINASLKRHIRIKHTRLGLIKCSSCDYQANCKSTLVHHMAKHMNRDQRPLKCLHCEYRTARNYSLVRHIRFKHASEGLIDCKSCDYQTVNRSTLDDHIKRLHSIVSSVRKSNAQDDD